VAVAAPVLTGALLFVLYWWTLAPTISELHDNLDSAELVVVASVSGVAHPPGGAIWLPLGRLALDALPFIEEPAQRTNVLSAFCMATAGAVLASAALRWRRSTPAWAGILAGLMAGVAPITWAQGLVTEVLALQALLTALALWLAPDASEGRRWPAFALVLGLLSWNHPTGLALAVPLAGACLLRHRPSRSVTTRALAAFAIPGIWSVTYLWLRADAPIAWGDTDSVRGIWAHLSGDAYQGALDWSSVGASVPETLRRTFAQLPPPAWLLVTIGAATLGRARPALAAAVAVTCALIVVFVSAYRVTGRQDYLATITLIASLATAYGAVEAWAWLRRRLPTRAARLASAAIVWGLLGVWVVVVGDDVSRRGDTALRDAAVTLIRQQEPGAIIETTSDLDLFALWYAQVILGERPDVTIRQVSGIAPVIGGGTN
jgi:hypothetical protein